MSKPSQLKSMPNQPACQRRNKCSSLKRLMEQRNRFGERKKMSEMGHMVDETMIQIDAISENNVDKITNFIQTLRRTNQILLEEAKYPALLQLKAKIAERKLF